MKIALKTSAGGGDGVSRFPTLRIPFNRCFASDGKPVRLELVRALACEDNTVQYSSDENVAALVVGAAFIDELEAQMKSIADNSDHAHLEDVSDLKKPTSSAERKMNKGRVSYCNVRITYRSTDNTVLCRVSYGRGKTVRDDNAYAYAKDLAIFVAQALFVVRDEFIANGSTTAMVVADDEGCEGICEAAVRDAAWRIECKRIDEANAARLKCEHLFGWEWCKGCKTDCPNWVQGGKCADIVKPEMPRIHG